MGESKNSEYKAIKDYLYFNEVEVSSVLAQLENGYPSSLKEIKESSTSETNGNSSSENDSFNAGINAFAKVDYNGGQTVSESSTKTDSSGEQNVVELKYEDFALNVVENEMNSQIKTIRNNPSDGTFVKFKTKFDMINFTNIVEMNNVKDGSYMKAVSESSGLPFDEFESSINLLDALFTKSVIIKCNKSLIIADERNIRINGSQLSLINLTDRDLTVFGRILATVKEEDLDDEVDSNNPGLSISRVLVNIASKIFNLESGDKIIRPIALYFDSEKK